MRDDKKRMKIMVTCSDTNYHQKRELVIVVVGKKLIGKFIKSNSFLLCSKCGFF